MGNNQTAGLSTSVTELRREVAETTSTPTARSDDPSNWEVMWGEVENCMVEPRKSKMLLNDDVIYQTLLCLPVISLLRFKRVCSSWRAWIESSNFIKQHLHRHHYDPSLKYKNRNIVFRITDKNSSITFSLTSIEGFVEPDECLQLNCSHLHGHFPIKVLEIVTYNGIICLNLLNCKRKQSICLWNPATKQSRILPQSPLYPSFSFSIGFGFDTKSNDYKVVKLVNTGFFAKIGVFSLNTSSWKSLTTFFPSGNVYGNPRMPFNMGTCFFWGKYDSFGYKGIFCFDFSSGMFRSISLPPCDHPHLLQCISVVDDKIACFLQTDVNLRELWVFNDYGAVNESWTKLYSVGMYFSFPGWPVAGVSMNGNYIFFVRLDQMCRFNVVTKETDFFTLKDVHHSFYNILVGFKESLVLVKEENKCSYLP